jgi:hypothetical protein
MRPETVTQPDAERAISTEALAFRKRAKVPRVLPFGRCLAHDYLGMGN